MKLVANIPWIKAEINFLHFFLQTVKKSKTYWKNTLEHDKK
jgi:hypothetical protein